VHFRGQSLERHRDERVAILATRSVLDSFLVEKAIETGIQVTMGEKAVGFTEDEDAVEVYTDKGAYRARFVVVAEGAHGRLKHRIRRKDGAHEHGICIVTEIEASDAQIDRFIYNALDIHFGVANMGYGWIFPHGGYFSVGIGGLARDLPNPRAAMVHFLRANGFDGQYRLRGHLIPAGGIKRKLTSSRVVLTGDAAGFVDSFYGEGIAYAIRSGQIAAQVISDILRDQRPASALRGYEDICDAEFGDNLRYSLVLARLMHRFPRLFFRILSSSTEAMDAFLEIPAQKRTYRSYLRWLLPRVPRYLLGSERERATGDPAC
jgi:flavin-dependent dehydrogenase